jgi:hypothetical protein
MNGIRIVIIVIVLFGLGRIYARWRQGHLSRTRMLGWAVLWLGVLAAGLAPRLTDALSRWLGVERGATLLTFLGFVLLFYMVFILYVRLERQQRELTDLVRQIALREDKDREPPARG